MDNPGEYDLGTAALAAINAATAATVITSAGDASGATQVYLDRLEGMLSANIEANFVFGSGGGTLKADVFTTLNQGTTWIHVVRFAFTTSSANKVFNLSGLTPRLAAYTPVTLGDDLAVDGIIGGRWRASILKASADYGGNTSLALRLNAR